MTASRRDFMKLFGVSLASLLLTRCRAFFPTPYVSCYTPVAVDYSTPTPDPASLDARGRLRLCWLRFGELAQKTSSGENPQGDGWDDPLGNQLSAGHRAALDELLASGELTPPVADLVQEAYDAAVYHVWRSNASATCYAPVLVDYAPASAGALVQQAGILGQLAAQGTIDPQTLSAAQAALEHDLAFYTLSDADVQALYARLVQEYQEKGQSIPSFDALQLALTPDAMAAAQFIVALLAER
jgi:hypothetical protein